MNALFEVVVHREEPAVIAAHMPDLAKGETATTFRHPKIVVRSIR